MYSSMREGFCFNIEAAQGCEPSQEMIVAVKQKISGTATAGLWFTGRSATKRVQQGNHQDALITEKPYETQVQSYFTKLIIPPGDVTWCLLAFFFFIHKCNRLNEMSDFKAWLFWISFFSVLSSALQHAAFFFIGRYPIYSVSVCSSLPDATSAKRPNCFQVSIGNLQVIYIIHLSITTTTII